MSTVTEIPYLPTTPEERRAYEAFYHEHKEAHVPQSYDQDRVSDDVGDILSVHAPHLWTARDLCCYWSPGNNRVYVAPDVLAGEPPAPQPGMRSYRQWEHGPLRLVLEIVSEESHPLDRGPKMERYAEPLRPDGYLYFDPDYSELRLWRWDGAAYQEVAPDAGGRSWSAAARLWFVPEGRMLRLEDAAGTRLRNYREEAEHSRAESARADSAEARADAARQEREAAEREKQELAARLAALEAELKSLRGKTSPPEAGTSR